MISDGSNPLAEVALALSMAFFSLMILMLFSVTQKSNTASVSQAVEIQNSQQPLADKPSDTTLVIYHNGRFLDEELRVISPTSLTEEPVLLALDAEANLQDILVVTEQLSGKNLQVTTLTEEWKLRLQP